MSTPSRPGGSDQGVPRPDQRSGERPAARGGNGSSGGAGEGRRSEPAPWQRGGTGRGGAPGLDAPTTQMRRPDLSQDMPDLSSVPRTSGGRPSTGNPPPARRGEPRSGNGQGGTARPATDPRARDRRPGEGGQRATATVQRGRKGPRRASLQVKHFDPWSVLKLSLVLSFALFLVWMVAVGVLYLVLDGMGVWDRLNTTFTDFVSVNDPNAQSSPLIGPGRVFGVAAIVGAINIVLLTALATISSFIYNLTSDLVGGVEVTLTERD